MRCRMRPRQFVRPATREPGASACVIVGQHEGRRQRVGIGQKLAAAHLFVNKSPTGCRKFVTKVVFSSANWLGPAGSGGVNDLPGHDCLTVLKRKNTLC